MLNGGSGEPFGVTKMLRTFALAAALAACAVLGARADGDPKNEGNDLLLRASPTEQAAMLAHVVRAGPDGESCVGQTAFYQGNKDTKPPTPGKKRAKAIKGDEGSAFWSVRCTSGRAYQVMAAGRQRQPTGLRRVGATRHRAGVLPKVLSPRKQCSGKPIRRLPQRRAVRRGSV